MERVTVDGTCKSALCEWTSTQSPQVLPKWLSDVHLSPPVTGLTSTQTDTGKGQPGINLQKSPGRQESSCRGVVGRRRKEALT